jgi:phage N-6-adenine-methyltransferase
MNSALMFSKASDEWSTPQALFDGLHLEFCFALDAAASAGNTKCVRYLRDGLDWSWRDLVCDDEAVWLNPPYSKCREFIAKAAAEADKGCTVVCLVPSRTDTKWWHEHVWNHDKPRDGVEVRFLKGRVKFGEGKNSAPFPSVVIIFRGAR